MDGLNDEPNSWQMPGEAPEGEEPAPKQFTIEVEGRDLILDAIEKGVSGQLGIEYLKPPVESLQVELASQENTFDLVGVLQLQNRFGYKSGDDQKILRLLRAVADKLGQTVALEERGAHLVLTAQRGTRLVLSCNDISSSLSLTTGLAYERTQVSSIPEKRVFSGPAHARETSAVVLEDFSDALATLVNTMYQAEQTVPPPETLVLHPPKVEVGRSKSPDLRSLLDGPAPAELLGKLEIENPQITFDQIGGQTAAKRELEGLVYALKNPELYQKYGIEPAKGILLYGPPGTGKTLLAKALASQADARFFHVKAADIGSKWYGQSEKIVQAIFELSRQGSRKTIIFFDEIDAIAPQRDGAHEATQKVVGTLLENMDGLATAQNVMVVASTNRLESIDAAVRRAGRIDRIVEVPLPDEHGREQIFAIHIEKAEHKANRGLFAPVNVELILSNTEGYNGADLAEIIRRTLEEKVRQEGAGLVPGLVTTDDILAEIGSYERVRVAKQSVDVGFRTSKFKTGDGSELE